MPEIYGRDPADLLEADIDELGILMLQRHTAGEQVHERNEMGFIRDHLAEQNVATDVRQRMMRRGAQAWAWLRREGFVALEPMGSGDWEFVTEARDEVTATYLAESRNLNLLRQAQLDPRIRQKVMALFRRGLYPEALFFALRTVEEETRTAAGLPNSVIGKDVMVEAFGSGKPLDDPSLDRGESDGRKLLFMGAIQALKNPSSHRTVNVTDPQEAAELVLFANALLRILERAKQATAVP
jgi:uncharacterized protein (TIGR02391 family)